MFEAVNRMLLDGARRNPAVIQKQPGERQEGYGDNGETCGHRPNVVIQGCLRESSKNIHRNSNGARRCENWGRSQKKRPAQQAIQKLHNPD